MIEQKSGVKEPTHYGDDQNQVNDTNEQPDIPDQDR